jgi:two-component system OmpR family response regulator
MMNAMQPNTQAKSSMRVLVVEDDAEMADLVKEVLVTDGHEVDLAEDGETGLARARDGAYDVIVLDRMLPKKQGLAVVSELRQSGVSTPVMFLSALGDEENRVEGLEAGSDDYLAKPFYRPELVARVRALLRARDRAGPVTRLQVGDLEMDLLARTVHRGGKKLDLQPREFRLLEFLMRNAGEVVTREMLLQKVWDYNFDPQTNVIDVHISRLRGKIDKDFSPQLLHTVRGSGYRLEA